MAEQDIVIQQSPISGNGVFTNQDIAAGQTICFLEGERCSLDEMIKRVKEGTEKPSDPLEIDDEEYIDLDERSRTFNHSCSPNAFVRGINELIAMRNIVRGEEITYDYSTTMNDNEQKITSTGRALWTCACTCGSTQCRGIIDQFKTLPKGRREFYLRNQYLPDFMLKAFGQVRVRPGV